MIKLNTDTFNTDLLSYIKPFVIPYKYKSYPIERINYKFAINEKNSRIDVFRQCVAILKTYISKGNLIIDINPQITGHYVDNTYLFSFYCLDVLKNDVDAELLFKYKNAQINA